VIRMTPEFWTASVLHRTQILYHADCAMIVQGLNLRPGGVVVESGTGSGSLSTSLARAIAPHGHVHSFEFNEQRVIKAREDFENNGLTHLITCRHRNVCEKGFPKVGGGVDAVFLDLPTPWEVVESAKNILRPEGRLCSFSPCMEQVQRTCLAMDKLGFKKLRTIECLLKTYQVLDQNYPSPDFGTDELEDITPVPASPPNTTTTTTATTTTATTTAATATATTTTTNTTTTTTTAGEKKDEERPAKRQKQEGGDKKKGEKRSYQAMRAQKGPDQKVTVARPFLEMRGHTGYLTFAELRADS